MTWAGFAQWSVLFLSVGAAWGILFLLMRLLRSILGFDRIAEAILDILLCLTGMVMAFFCALAFDSGRLRLIQMLLHVIGAAAVIIAFGPLVEGISRKIRVLIIRIKRKILSVWKRVQVKRIKRKKERKKRKILARRSKRDRKTAAAQKKTTKKRKKNKKALEKTKQTGI